MLKRCSKCGLEKDIADFYRETARKDGHQIWCKKCSFEYCNENNEKIREYHKEYYKANTEKVRTHVREYNQTRNGKIVAARKAKKFFQTPKGKMAMKKVMHRRRGHMKSTESTLTSEQWQNILRMQDNRCNTCKKKFTKKREATTDHIIPLSKGGCLTFENVQALCRSCNSSKNAKLDREFIQTWSHR